MESRQGPKQKDESRELEQSLLKEYEVKAEALLMDAFKQQFNYSYAKHLINTLSNYDDSTQQLPWIKSLEAYVNFLEILFAQNNEATELLKQQSFMKPEYFADKVRALEELNHKALQKFANDVPIRQLAHHLIDATLPGYTDLETLIQERLEASVRLSPDAVMNSRANIKAGNFLKSIEEKLKAMTPSFLEKPIKSKSNAKQQDVNSVKKDILSIITDDKKSNTEKLENLRVYLDGLQQEPSMKDKTVLMLITNLLNSIQNLQQESMKSEATPPRDMKRKQ